MKMKDLYYILQRLVLKKEDLERWAKKMGYKGEERERETTELLGQEFDILGFDSCVMGMLEVGYQFALVAKTMIASEGSVPNAGWTYAKILGCLAREDGSNRRHRKSGGTIRQGLHPEPGLLHGRRRLGRHGGMGPQPVNKPDRRLRGVVRDST